METILHGVTIDGLHTWRDLYLIPICRPVVQPPIEKTKTLDIEGMNGEADLSHGLTGYPVFGSREGSWQFWLDTERYQEEKNFYGPVGNMAYLEIQQKLIAKMKQPFRTKIILDDDPQFYYVGRVWVSGKPTYQYDHAKITLRYQFYPYKYLVAEPNGDWLWDSFCFETDLATRQMKGVAIAAGKEETFPLVDSDKPTGVYVTSSGKATASLENQNGTNFTLVSEKYGTKVDCTDGLSQTELVYPFKVLSYKLSLRTVETPVYFKNPRNTFAGLWWDKGEKQVSLSVRKKGSSVLLASLVWTNGIEDYYGKTITLGGTLSAELEPNTDYELVVASKTSGLEFFGTSIADSETLKNNSSYISVARGGELSSGTGKRACFGGTMSFYAGDGAVLTPGERTNIGVIASDLENIGRTVVIKADEDVTVNVECRQAFL